jgi:chorismate mutase/prephenate dehydratase
VREDGDPTQAAIASPEAAAHFGLAIREANINDQPENYTRFVIVARQPLADDPALPHKVSLLLVTDHTEGALFRCLKVLHEHRLNMTKLESRPIPNEPWQYQFYVDFEGHVADPPVQEALALLGRRTRRLRVLGCYPSRPEAATGDSQ